MHARCVALSYHRLYEEVGIQPTAADKGTYEPILWVRSSKQHLHSASIGPREIQQVRVSVSRYLLSTRCANGFYLVQSYTTNADTRTKPRTDITSRTMQRHGSVQGLSVTILPCGARTSTPGSAYRPRSSTGTRCV